MKDSLEDIPLRYREPLVLYYFEDMSYKDISAVLKVPVSTVGIRIRRAKEKLKGDIHLKKIYEERGIRTN